MNKTISLRIKPEHQIQLEELKTEKEFKGFNKSKIIRRCINIYYANVMENKQS